MTKNRRFSLFEVSICENEPEIDSSKIPTEKVEENP